ncbi:MAG TPA: bacteriohopanetetrol glucosamine biosynthesis glycosyltransferase HpnI [Bryobacteraceae bacterium]|nr:bacteriohopanetetrol glucosamine biosynthesis glycosyltransferase HpnI [Bryobacteraceae bacterium]
MLLMAPLPQPFTVRTVLETVAAIGTMGSLFFYFLAALSLASFISDRRKKRQQPPLPPTQLPAVSILKPCKGVDPEIWESFCSHCEQEYPEFQLIFGVSDRGDPAIEVVRKLQAKYPKLPIELIVCDRVLGANIKVSNLAQMLPASRYELLLVNDSDIRVPPDYLRKVIAPLADPSVGLVTSLYAGVASPIARPTLGSRLEALGISTDFVPGVLSARFLERGLHFGLGSTLAFRRGDLEAIGGFEALLDYLADDYELGRRIASTGKKVELSAATVTTFLPAYTLRQFFRHQLRWSRTIRDARRGGYAGFVFTFGLPWALATLLAARGAAWASALLAMTFAARFAVGFVAAEVVLRDRQALRNMVLLPLRDLIAPFVWAASFMGNRVHWRGDVFDLKDGRLASAKPKPPADSKK